MTIPLSIHVGGSKRGSDAALNPASPESARQAAPTLRPPPLPTQLPLEVPASSPVAAAAPASDAERRSWGFTSVIRHMSLRDWLRWIGANHSDAVLRVRTPEGGSGTIWCTAGKVIDAGWAELTAEAALREMLGLASGAVTIDFEPLEAPPRSARPPMELSSLLEAASGQAGDVPATETAAALSASEPPPLMHPSLAPARPRPRVSRAEYLAAGLLLPALVLGAFAIGRLRAADDSDAALTVVPEHAQQIKSGLLPPPPVRTAESEASPVARDLPVIAFAAIEVEPANAEIWLDHSLVGLGRIEVAPIADGALHELHFVAEGHTARSIFFIDAPPAGRVILERAPGASPSAEAPPRADAEDAEAREVRRAPRRRAAAPAPAPPAPPPPAQRQRPVAEAAAPARASEVKPSARVQVIDERTPQVQVVE
jgi:hypothetical protein